MFHARVVLLSAVCCGLLGCALLKEGNETTDSLDWYGDNDRARELSQLTEEEWAKLAGTDLPDVRPVIAPMPPTTCGTPRTWSTCA